MCNDESNPEKTCRLFGELVDRLIAKGLLTSGVDEPPRLQLVTDENAHEFSQPPKRRGRLPKPRIGGNVVAFPQPAPRPTSAYEKQKLVLAALLDDRRVKAGLPRMGTKAMLEVVDEIVEGSS